MTDEQTLSQENIEKILKGITIPSPPQIIADLQMEMAMPDPDLNEMANMISKDPGLSGGGGAENVKFPYLWKQGYCFNFTSSNDARYDNSS